MKRLAPLLLFAACASTTAYTREPRPCQAQAVEAVWRGCYGRTDRPPDVWWIPDRALNCQDPGRAKGLRAGSLCVGGYSWRDGMSLVNYRTWWDADLAHEAAHVALLRDGQDPDVTHQTAAFAPGGAVQACNARLRAARLCGP